MLKNLKRIAVYKIILFTTYRFKLCSIDSLLKITEKLKSSTMVFDREESTLKLWLKLITFFSVVTSS